MKKTQLIAAYHAISELFLYPGERDGNRIKIAMEYLADTRSDIKTPLAKFLTIPAASDNGEYVATLELSPPIPLYLGSYLFDEPQSCRGVGISGRNAYMMELANIYRHFGVEFAGREMTDFVPVVVEFLAVSLDRMDLDQIGLRRYFVETLLINAIESLLSALRKHESPYVLLIDALRLALTEDIALMAKGPKWLPPDDGDAHLAAMATYGLGEKTLDNGVEL